MGLKALGVVKVLSTKSLISFSWHKVTMPEISATLKVGLETNSIKISFVFGLMASLTFAILVMSVRETSMPNRGKSDFINLKDRPYN